MPSRPGRTAWRSVARRSIRSPRGIGAHAPHRHRAAPGGGAGRWPARPRAASAAESCSKSRVRSRSRSDQASTASTSSLARRRHGRPWRGRGQRLGDPARRAGRAAAAAARSGRAAARARAGSGVGLAPDQAEGLVEEAVLLDPAHQHRVERPVEVVAAGQPHLGHGLHRGEDPARARWAARPTAAPARSGARGPGAARPRRSRRRRPPPPPAAGPRPRRRGCGRCRPGT